MLLEKGVNQSECLLLIRENVIRLLDRTAGNKVVGCSGQLVGCGSGDTNIHFGIELS